MFLSLDHGNQWKPTDLHEHRTTNKENQWLSLICVPTQMFVVLLFKFLIYFNMHINGNQWNSIKHKWKSMKRLNKTIVFIDSATQINKTDDLLYLSFDFHAEQLVFIDPWSRPINTLFSLYICCNKWYENTNYF